MITLKGIIWLSIIQKLSLKSPYKYNVINKNVEIDTIL